jgi:hypothetical protein
MEATSAAKNRFVTITANISVKAEARRKLRAIGSVGNYFREEEELVDNALWASGVVGTTVSESLNGIVIDEE